VQHALDTSPFVGGQRGARLDADQRFVLYGVSWRQYVALREALDERSGVRTTYLEGTLELMSPSFLHEDLKKQIARLIEAWADENDVDLNGYGSVTLREELVKRGLEPDECYCIGRVQETPDFAVEVVVSSSEVDKLEVYRGLGVPEVWVWKDGKLVVLRLVAGAYQQRARSEALPGLDLQHFVSFVREGASQSQVVKAYRAALRAGRR
jgi:Uma2 family endonuclease